MLILGFYSLLLYTPKYHMQAHAHTHIHTLTLAF